MALCKEGRLKEALQMLEQEGIQADPISYICLLQGCIKMKSLAQGKQVHSHITQSEFKANISLGNTLVNMYTRCGSMVDARQVFEEMPQRDIFTWTMLVAGYAKHGHPWQAFKVYEQMQQEGVTPDKVMFVCILNVCASLGALDMGKQLHADIIKSGIVSDVVLENSIVNMYAKCGSLKDARRVFDEMAKRNVVSWNAIITGHAQQGHGEEALKIYEQMQLERVNPDNVTFICILNACASTRALEKGKRVHADIINARTASDIKLETALVDMYAKCGSVKDARKVFNQMLTRNVITWTVMITGYAQEEHGEEALRMYEQMQQDEVKPNEVTFICILNACASLGALEKGKQIHTDIVKAGIVSYIHLENTLLDMYAKCGSVEDARLVFDKMATRDVVSWNAMIEGCAQHGGVRESLHLFEQMRQQGLKPDHITFLSVISACRHVGLVDEGRHYFDCMRRDYGLTPKAEHFGCMVDLLGRTGLLDEAEDLINKMPSEPDASVWRALLGACRIHSDLQVAERAARCILKSNPQHSEAYVLLLDIYAAAGRWDDKAKLTQLMEERGVSKEPMQTCIEVNNQ